VAQDAQLKMVHDKRAQVFVDPRLGTARFGAECEKWIARHPGREGTRKQYRSVLSAHVRPVLGQRTLASAAQARDDLIDLLTVRMGGLSKSRRELARGLVTGVLDEAVRAGKIPSHRCAGIVVADNRDGVDRSDFVFPSHAQLAALAKGIDHPVSVWLMRGCGLRIEEALAVQKSCFRDRGSVLRVFEQASGDGRKTAPLKHRTAGEYRDIPVPGFLWEMVKDLPDGYLFMKDGRLPAYGSYHAAFTKQRKAVGIPAGFRPHSLRHAFASVLQVSRIAFDASFGSSREHGLPAAQRAAVWCRVPA
jgi:integrase